MNIVKEMTVADLIRLLGTFPQDLPVVYSVYSEQCLLEEDSVMIRECCLARPDGWVQDKRPDMPARQYLVIA